MESDNKLYSRLGLPCDELADIAGPAATFGPLTARPVRKSMSFSTWIDARSTVIFHWNGLDRTNALAKITGVIAHDPCGNVDDLFVNRLEDYASIDLIIRRRAEQDEANAVKIERLNDSLRDFCERDQFFGKQIPVRKVETVSLVVGDEPRTLHNLITPIGRREMNISGLRKHTWIEFGRPDAEAEELRRDRSMCRLVFNLEAPSTGRRQVWALVEEMVGIDPAVDVAVGRADIQKQKRRVGQRMLDNGLSI